MFEDDVAIDVAHDPVAAPDQMDGPMSTLAVEKSAPSSPAPAALNGHAQDRLQEINQLINDLEAVTEANNANVVILRGKLAVSQQQLETKAAELEGLLEETARHEQQLQATQTELAAVSASKASLEADYSASQQQLETKAAELEGLLEETARHEQQLQATQTELAAVSASKASLEADYSASQQQLETKAAELEDLKEEAELLLQQLQQGQAKLQEQALHLQQVQALLEEAKEENELVLLQLHQVQEELEVVFLEGRDKDVKLKEQDLKLNWNRNKRVQLEAKAAELEDLKEENELTLLQLHRVQKELEHYFQESQRLSKEKEKQEKLNRNLNSQQTILNNQKTMLFTGYRDARKDWRASREKLGNKIINAACKKLLSATYEN